MSLRDRDKSVVWHPFTQMKTEGEALPIVRGEGVYLYDEDGKAYIDVNSSWWVNVHGHCHPKVAQAVSEQANRLEHAVFAGLTHEPAVKVAEHLIKVLPGEPDHIFFSDNGSTAVEVAIKCSIQYWYNAGTPKKRIIAMEGAYHGDTFGAMSVSARDQFNRPFEPFMFDVDFIPVPTGENWEEVKTKFTELCESGNTAAFIVEPMVQGAAGMVMYRAEYLEQLAQIAKMNKVIFIADEVMTGFGRTGKMFATDHLETAPDIVCMSKGITAGFMAMGVTSFPKWIYEIFLDDDKVKGFLHGHSFTANPLTCAAALANFELFEDSEVQSDIEMISRKNAEFAASIDGHERVEDVRYCGTILAIEIKSDSSAGYFSNIRNKAYNYFLKNGLISRPLGNVIYVNPPFCITEEEMDRIFEVYRAFLDGHRA